MSILTWYATTLVCIVAWVPWSPWARYRTPLLLLTISTSVSIAIVGWMKTWTNVDCPWDLHRYGGMKAFFGLFADRPDAYAAGNCFPAGHAAPDTAGWHCISSSGRQRRAYVG
ncbi:hypothetical protein [Xanthomonas hydrangeae]|uniref:hypothetical protein n=1 Tax=Xanthomonas hydrangeae TaxID=2775159 RepID=UPI00196625FF